MNSVDSTPTSDAYDSSESGRNAVGSRMTNASALYASDEYAGATSCRLSAKSVTITTLSVKSSRQNNALVKPVARGPKALRAMSVYVRSVASSRMSFARIFALPACCQEIREWGERETHV